MAQDVNIKINVDANQAEQSTVNYKKTLKDLQAQMVELQVSTNGLANATDEQRAQYAALEQQAGQLSDAISDVSARVRANADDYQTFNAALEGLKGGAAVAQGLVGTLDLLGISNTGVESVVKTLMSLQGVMNSINAVQQVFNKDSKVRIALQKLLTTSVKQTAVAEGEATAASGALAAGEGVATAASFTLAGACKAVGVAIKSIPVIGWILAAIAALISLTALVVSLIDFGDEGLEQQKQAEENQRKVNEAYAEGEKAIAKERRELELNIQTLSECEEGTDEWNDAAQSVAKTLGVGVEWIKKNKDKVNELALAWLNVKKVQATQDSLLKQMADNDVKVLQLEIAKTEIMGAHYKTRRETVERWAEVFGWSQDQIDELVDATNKTKTSNEEDYRTAMNRFDAVINQSKKVFETATNTYQVEYDKLEKSIKDSKELLTETVEESKQVDEQLAKNHEKTNKKIKKSDEDLAKERQKHLEALVSANEKASNKINSYWKTYNKQIEKENEETYYGRLDNLSREYAQTIDTLDKELEEYKNYYNNLTEEDKKALGDQLVSLEQFEKAQEGLRKQALNNYVNGINKENDAEAENEKKKERDAIDAQNRIDDARLATRLANLKEGSEEYWELQEEIEAERYEQEMEELRRKLEDKQITQDEFDAIAEQKEAEHQQRIRDIEKETVAARIEGYAQYADYVKNIVGTMSNFVMALQDAELANAEGDEKKQKEIKKKYAVANMMMTIGQIAVETVMGATSALANAIRDLGFPAGPIVGGVMAALVTATGIANVAKAVAEKNKIMKAKRGAYVVGPSHAEGGVPYELEGGEAVLNKRAMSVPAYRNMASAMNVATGGVAFPGTNPNMGMTAMVDERAVDVIVRRTIAGITSIPVVVSEESITNAQRNVGVSVERSRI